MLIEEIKLREGFRSKPYEDTLGILTIGYGLNLQDGITEEEASWLLEHRVKKNLRLLQRLPFWNDLDEVRQEVLQDMCYNLGYPRLMGFKKMLAAIAAKDYQAAANEMMDSKWYKQVKTRAAALVERMRYGWK